ncbi:MAG: ATP-binding protein [Tissierellia bacterium]|nr:ATP-binding protein [Tissierellia bacterium]
MERICHIQGSVPSNINSVQEFLTTTMKRIEAYISDEDTIFDIRLIINELVVNGAKHGNGWNGNKEVFLAIHLSGEDITIQVKDEGQGICHAIDSYDPLDMKDSGRGLVIVRALTDDLIYQGNQIVAIKHLKL